MFYLIYQGPHVALQAPFPDEISHLIYQHKAIFVIFRYFLEASKNHEEFAIAYDKHGICAVDLCGHLLSDGCSFKYLLQLQTGASNPSIQDLKLTLDAGLW